MHSLLESHVPEPDCYSRWRQCIWVVPEVPAMAEELLTVARVLANKILKGLSPEPILHSHSYDFVQNAF